MPSLKGHLLWQVSRENICCEAAREHYDYLLELFKKKRCKYCRNKTPVVLTYEQKLVDTMLVSDLLWGTRSASKGVVFCLASDDDDMVPGLLTVVANGIDIYHIRVKHDSYTYEKYIDIAKKTIPEFDTRYHLIKMH